MKVTCPNPACDRGQERAVCRRCDGEGRVFIPGHPTRDIYERCYLCGGQGEVTKICSTCLGTGKVEK